MLDPQYLERQLAARWGNLPGVQGVRVRQIDGRWAVVVQGYGDPPRAITSTVSVRTGQRLPAILPVLWRTVPQASPHRLPPPRTDQVMLPANDQMWAGASPVEPRRMPVIDPRDHRTVPTEMPLPRAPLDEYQLALSARTPELPFWSQPFDLRECVCCENFATPQTVLTYPVESSRQLTLRGISYHAINVPAGHGVEFRVDRSGNTQAMWRDLMVTPAGDPAEQFAFAGHLRPMPLNLLIDHDQTVTVTVSLLGPPPFNMPPVFPANAQVCVMLRGWLSMVNDPRDGAPRPIDVGDLNDVAQGNRDIVSDYRDAQLADAVQRVINQGVYEIEHPEQGGRR